MNKQTYIKTDCKEWDEFYVRIKKFLEKDTLDLKIDGETVRGYRSPDSRAIWIRDHSDILRGAKYLEKDMKSTVDHFAATQAANGRIFDYVTTFPDKLPSERENWTKYVRVPVEADVEYRFIKAAFLGWQATGDDQWIVSLLPSMERALDYILTNPLRWDEATGLVKRAYTIDTWDFAYTAGHHDWLQMQIDENTFWGIMHGDNSGYYEAFRIMALLYEYIGKRGRSNEWQERAEALRENMNRVCWNGRFYTHFVKLKAMEIEGVDESSQLSLSNPIDINRGTATHEMAVSILNEYIERGRETDAFAEWFSIDPPFPSGIFGEAKLTPGSYINGGILPLVGGELARAAFEHGFESYGLDILKQYFEMISRSGETYLWYFPDGTTSCLETSTSPEVTPTDGWGSSAMLYAFIEGLAGVEDRAKLFQQVRLSPRWLAAGIYKAEVCIQYASSSAGVEYTFDFTKDKISLDLRSSGSDVRFHVLLPGGAAAKDVKIDKGNVPFDCVKVEQSPYVDFRANIEGKAGVEIFL
ncbi:hypothetical protein ACFLT9_00995 [Acidobacteriota bacterium]